MMLAHGVEGDVALDHQIVGGHRKGFRKMLGSAFVHANGKLCVHARNASGRLDQALAVRILTDTLEQQAHGTLNFFLIDHRDP